jgi:PKD repeat protein
VKPGVTGTSQMVAFDRDAGQTLTFSVSVAPSHGTATVSSTGLVTYTPNAGYTGNDSIIVSTTDNGIPPKTSGIAISVVVSNLNPPVLPSASASRTLIGTMPVQMGMGFNSASTEIITSSNGAITTAVWDFGDGTREFTSDKQWAGIGHNFADPGTYQVTFTATDAAGLSSSISFPVMVAAIEVPVVRVTMSPSTGGAAPLSVNFDASASTYSGAITSYRWQFCGANPEVVTTAPTLTHTFSTNCSVRVRAVGAGSATPSGQATISVPVGATFAGSTPAAQISFLGLREVPLGQAINFDSSRSIDPNIGATLTVFNWNFNDFQCSPACTSTALTPNHSYGVVGSAFPSLQVTNSIGFFNLTSFQVATLVRAGTHAPRSILTASSVRGVAPFSVSFNAISSYGYDGATIQAYNINYGDGSAAGTTNTPSHTFSAAGVYIVNGTVTDSDGNSTSTSLTITATSSRSEAGSLDDPTTSDPDREAQRDLLAGACSQNDGASCFALSQMFAEDGDTYTSNVLKAKACGLGYQAACSK